MSFFLIDIGVSLKSTLKEAILEFLFMGLFEVQNLKLLQIHFYAINCSELNLRKI